MTDTVPTPAPDPFVDGKSTMAPGPLQRVDVGGMEYVNVSAAMLVRVVDIDRRWRVQVVIADRTNRLLASPVGVGSPNGQRAVEQVLRDWAEGAVRMSGEAVAEFALAMAELDRADLEVADAGELDPAT